MGCSRNEIGRLLGTGGVGEGGVGRRVGGGGVKGLCVCIGIKDCTFVFWDVLIFLLAELEGKRPNAREPANVGLTTRLPVSIALEGCFCLLFELIPKNRVSSAACWAFTLAAISEVRFLAGPTGPGQGLHPSLVSLRSPGQTG